MFRAVNRVIEGGHEPRRFATDMLDRFRDLIVLASVPDAISSGLLDVPPDRAEALRGQAERYGLASLTRAADIVAAGLDQMRGATSPRLLLELMCAQVLLPAAATDERSVLARLERLEAGAAAAAAGTSVPAGAAARRRADPYPERARPAPQPAPAPDGRAAARRGPARRAARPAHPAAPAAAAAAGPQAPPSRRSTASRPQRRRPRRQPGSRRRRRRPLPGAATRRAAASRARLHARPGAAGAAGGSRRARAASVTVDVLRQAWPSVVEAIKAKGRVAAIVIGNASVASFDEGVLTLRFPRQGDVKGFQGSKYEDLLKQAIAAMFGVNVVIRAVTGGGDAPSAARRPGPGPRRRPRANGQQPPASGQPSPGQPAPAPAGTPPGSRPDYAAATRAAGRRAGRRRATGAGVPAGTGQRRRRGWPAGRGGG